MQKIFDVHCHFSIENERINADSAAIGFTVENRGIEEHLAAMDRLGIDFSLLSCPTLRHLEDPAACAAYARAVNEAGAAIRDRMPGRFGFALSLPLPYVDAALEALDYAWNKLGAAAVSMTSNYAGMYLGDPALEPLFKQLEALSCPILLHPAAPPAWPTGPITGKILPMFEFIADSTRTVLDMIVAGVFDRYPGLKLVAPHAGACLPVAFNRMNGVLQATRAPARIPLDQLYFDLACDSFPQGAHILRTWTDCGHILYGTDFPAIPEFVLQSHLEAAKTSPAFEEGRADVLWNNALRLFPRCAPARLSR